MRQGYSARNQHTVADFNFGLLYFVHSYLAIKAFSGVSVVFCHARRCWCAAFTARAGFLTKIPSMSCPFCSPHAFCHWLQIAVLTRLSSFDLDAINSLVICVWHNFWANSVEDTGNNTKCCPGNDAETNMRQKRQDRDPWTALCHPGAY